MKPWTRDSRERPAIWCSSSVGSVPGSSPGCATGGNDPKGRRTSCEQKVVRSDSRERPARSGRNPATKEGTQRCLEAGWQISASVRLGISGTPERRGRGGRNPATMAAMPQAPGLGLRTILKRFNSVRKMASSLPPTQSGIPSTCNTPERRGGWPTGIRLPEGTVVRDHGPHKTTERSFFGKFARKPSTASASGKSCRSGRNPATTAALFRYSGAL